MSFHKLLVANRGEIAIRIGRAAAELNIPCVAVFSEDDARSLHTLQSREARPLSGRGPAAYLDAAQIIRAAVDSGCQAVHPGYGFLAESADFAARCAEAGLIFVGPTPASLALFGDKTAARRLAQSLDVPVLPGTTGSTTLAQAQEFCASLDGEPVIIKALAGGGGRGMRVVERVEDLAQALERCASEAQATFGNGDVYVERFMPRARHIEIQLIGDAGGAVTSLGERDCSLQRRHQKLIEISPSPNLSAATRDRLATAALRMARAARYASLGTFEFLVDAADGERFAFIEANPRVQVEHTVTEEVLGIDLIQAQLNVARGATLADLGLAQEDITPRRGYAMQLRINMETLDRQGHTMPSAGRLASYEMPSGPGVRVDGYGYTGYATNPSFDSLLAKLVVSVGTPGPAGYTALLDKAARALDETRIQGVQTNLDFLAALVRHPEVVADRVHTRLVEDNAMALADAARSRHAASVAEVALAEPQQPPTEEDVSGQIGVAAPMAGRIVRVVPAVGDTVRTGMAVVVIEAMKMEHVVAAPCDGIVTRVVSAVDDGVVEGARMLWLEPNGLQTGLGVGVDDEARPRSGGCLEALSERRASVLDEARPDAVRKQHGRGAMTARERIAALIDPETFEEIGMLVRPEAGEQPASADGVVLGTARIDGRPVVLVSQDFTVFGGSVGHLGRMKMERAARLALRHGIPLVMLLDGGGHRIQDGQNSRAYADAGTTLHHLAKLSGWAPIVGCVLGHGFAANTNFTGMADFVVMVRGVATMGIAGPALVKAGTGETVTAQELGGAPAQVDRFGLADLGVDSEQAALDAVRAFLSYLPSNARASVPLAGAAASAPADDAQRAQALLDIVPSNTRQAYNVLEVLERLADAGSLFEIKPTFARSLVTAFGRLDGRPVGFVANQPLVAGGMLDASACDKGAHFIAVCDAFGLPLIHLIDVPGFAIGSQAERTTLGRRSAKLLFELGHASVPRISIVLRKGYGLGYYAMSGGRSFDADACFAWPTAEICAMSVEGSVDVAYRKDYEAAADPAARRQQIIDGIRVNIGALQAAEGFGLDDVIDPRTTRRRLIEVLARAPARRDNGMPAKFRAIAPI